MSKKVTYSFPSPVPAPKSREVTPEDIFRIADTMIHTPKKWGMRYEISINQILKHLRRIPENVSSSTEIWWPPKKEGPAVEDDSKPADNQKGLRDLMDD